MQINDIETGVNRSDAKRKKIVLLFLALILMILIIVIPIIVTKIIIPPTSTSSATSKGETSNFIESNAKDYQDKDPSSESILNKIDKSTAEDAKKGFECVIRKCTNTTRRLSETSKSEELLKEDSLNNYLLRFHPIRMADYYSLEVSSSKDKNNTNEEETNDKIKNYNFTVLITNATESTIYLSCIISGTDLNNKNYNTIMDDSNSEENQPESESEDDNDNSDFEEDYKTTIEKWKNEIKEKYITEPNNNLLFNIIFCQINRIDGNLFFCKKPIKLDKLLYTVMLHAIKLYFPNLKRNNYNIYEKNSEGINLVTSAEKKEDNSTNSIILDENNLPQIETNSTKSDSTIENTTAKISKNSYIIFNKGTGKVEEAQTEASFNLSPNSENDFSTEEKEKILDETAGKNKLRIILTKTRDFYEEENNFLMEYSDIESTESIQDPLSKIEEQNDSINDNNNKTGRLLSENSLRIAFTKFDLFDTKALSVRFIGWSEFSCYLNNICEINVLVDVYIKNTQIVKRLEILPVCNKFTVYPLQRMYKCYSFMKVIVLDNIEKVSNMIIFVMRQINEFVLHLVNFGISTINELKQYFIDEKESIENILQSLVKSNKELTSFDIKQFPLIDQIFIQYFKDIEGMTYIQMSSDFMGYTDKLKNITQSVKKDGQDIKYLNLNEKDKNIIREQLEIILTNVQKEYEEIKIKFSYKDIVQSWNASIVYNISFYLIEKNEVFSFDEAKQKLSERIIILMNNETNRKIIEESEFELKTAYFNYDDLLSLIYNEQLKILADDIKCVNESLSKKNEILDDENYEKILKSFRENSILMNKEKYNELMSVFYPTDPKIRLEKMYLSHLNLKLNYLKEQLDIKFSAYKKDFDEFFKKIINYVNELSKKLRIRHKEELNVIYNQLEAIYQNFIIIYEELMLMFNKIIDPNYHPTIQEIIEMKKINLFDIPNHLQSTYTKLIEVLITLKTEILNLPSQIYEISRRPMKRQLELRNMSSLTNNIFDTYADYLGNFISGKLEVSNDELFYFFDKITKYLNINDTSYLINHFKQLFDFVDNFLQERNTFFNNSIINISVENVAKYIAKSNIIIGLKSRLEGCLPKPGGERLASYKCSLRDSLFLGSTIDNFGISFLPRYFYDIEFGADAYWGYNYFSNYEANFFILANTYAKVLVRFEARVTLFILRIIAYGQYNLVEFVGDLRFNMNLKIDDQTNQLVVSSRANIKVDLYPFSIEYGITIQILTIIWKRIRIWFIRIWIPWLSWKTIANFAVFIRAFKKNLVESTLFDKTNVKQLDSFEKFLISVALSIWFDATNAVSNS